MYDDVRDFVDQLHQLWAKTTNFGMGWYVKENDLIGGWCVMPVDFTPADAPRDVCSVADFTTETDAQFIAVIHGAIPELVKTVHDALDEADRLDTEKDDLIIKIADLEMDLHAAERDVDDYFARNQDLAELLSNAESENARLRFELESAYEEIQNLENRLQEAG